LGWPHAGKEEKLIVGDSDLELGAVKVWVDAMGYFKGPEALNFQVNKKTSWDDEKSLVGKDEKHGEDVVEKAVDEAGAANRASDLRGAG